MILFPVLPDGPRGIADIRGGLEGTAGSLSNDKYSQDLAADTLETCEIGFDFKSDSYLAPSNVAD